MEKFMFVLAIVIGVVIIFGTIIAIIHSIGSYPGTLSP
jgi:hypothetical protein